MAKREGGAPRDVRQFDEVSSQSEQPAAGQSQPIEFDPDNPSAGRTTAGAQSVQAFSSPDTFRPSEDFFKARDEVERMIGGFGARISAFAAAGPDSAGPENVVGVGVGLRYAGDTLTGELAVKVFVREKLPLARVSSAARVPPAVAGMATDVEAIGEVLLHSYAKRYPRPVPCGVSCSNVDLNGSGTLGCLVVLNNNKLCLLSNNHVLANENAARIGDQIIQPGNAEPAPAPDQLIGVLENFVPIQAAGNLVDAAVAWTSFRRVSAQHVTYSLNPQPVQPAIGMSVMKNGRTTQSTIGMLTDVGVNISVGYDPFPAGAEMRDQLAFRGVNGPFSKPGDSGSLIVTAGSKQPVALLFAGSSDNSVTFGNPIAAVMNALGINRFLGP
jgi:hypothetical protein